MLNPLHWRDDLLHIFEDHYEAMSETYTKLAKYSGMEHRYRCYAKFLKDFKDHRKSTVETFTLIETESKALRTALWHITHMKHKITPSLIHNLNEEYQQDLQDRKTSEKSAS